uniref:NADH-ubiquinone oxidoreductase chain 1 n=1 Tax=Aposthonia borneensis TaxID=1208762 RepID=A0A678RFI6_9NEOP|nr:NADH dehydrogenase subunit 1 [Aposthonia borneensis]
MIYYSLLSSFMLEIFVSVGAVFLTLMERRVLGYVQGRSGPGKVGYLGLFQPFSDAIKLFSKEHVYPYVGNYLYYLFCPVFGLCMSLFIWLVIPYIGNLYMFDLGMLFVFCCLGLGVYSIIFAGWASNSKYSLLGSFRSIAQMISYEVGLMVIMLSSFFLIKSLSFILFVEYQKYFWFVFLAFPVILMWFIMGLAETNRTPFDLAEGESELVSGYNVEYMGGGFSLIVLSEYVSIIFMCLLMGVAGLGSDLFSLFFYLKLVYVSFIFVWIRGSFPRVRYDKLMSFSWSIILPLSLNCMLYYSGFFIFLSK